MKRLSLILYFFIIACGTAEQDANTKVVLLGTGTPNADPQRSGPATAVVVGNQAYLVDAGVGVVRRAAEAAKLGIDALKPRNLDMAFITHLHSDHTLGLPDLVFTSWVLEREQPLVIYGPKGTRAMMQNIMEAWEEDINVRLNDIQPATHNGYKVEVYEIEAGVIYIDSLVTVSAFIVEHGAWGDEAYGFRFETGDGVVVVSGDTRYSKNLIHNSRGADILVHEVYSQAGWDEREPEWQRYHEVYHTSAPDLASIATQVKPGKLVLTHILFWGTSESDLLDEITSIYKGEVILGHDLDVIGIK